MKCAHFCYERYFAHQIMKNWPVMIQECLKESLHTISMTILLFQTTTLCSLETKLVIIRKRNFKKKNVRALNGA